MELPLSLATALDTSVSPVRMGTYLQVTKEDLDVARTLYLWDRDLAVALLGDLAILEVALRNAMSAQLEARWGVEWYKNPAMPLDDRSSKVLSTAWKQLKGPTTPGKLVAQCMFGFWCGLLDKGDHLGLQPRRVRCNYEVLWRGVLDRAFPGGRAQARADGDRWAREYAFQIVSRVKALRNRVAHHEPLVNGFPLPGQDTRVTAREAYGDVMKLAAMLDRDLHAFLQFRSNVPTILANRPSPA